MVALVPLRYRALVNLLDAALLLLLEAALVLSLQMSLVHRCWRQTWAWLLMHFEYVETLAAAKPTYGLACLSSQCTVSLYKSNRVHTVNKCHMTCGLFVYMSSTGMY